MGNIFIGWAENSIVPENKRVSLAGQFYERISEYVESDISATAMAIEADGEQAIFVSVDISKITEQLLERARVIFKEIGGNIDPNKIIVTATHSHTSLKIATATTNTISILNEFMPDGKTYTPLVDATTEDVITPEEAVELVAQKIALSAKEAWERREPALYKNAFGRAAVGFCRRVTYDDGSGQMWGDTNTANFVSMEGGNDSGIELIYTFDKNKKLTGVVANIACPSQILEHQYFISSDYWGKAKEYLRKKFGDHLFLLGLGGAGGDQCPRDLIRWVSTDTCKKDPNIHRPNYIERVADPSMFDLEGCRLAGKRIANEIISVYEELTDLNDEAELKHKVITIDMPLRKATITEYNNSVREIEYYMQKNRDKEVFNYEDNAAVYVHAGNIARYRLQQKMETFPIEVHILKLGDVAFATNPFELFLDYGNRIKARSIAKQTFILQLTCGGRSYLPTLKAEKAGHYSAYISSGMTGHEGGDLLTRRSIDEINEMFR
ncbi:MAG: hypothetical protein IKM06_05575 [Clostridia bacterium]|nr:hypothetical protein [Clostridia bacterium]